MRSCDHGVGPEHARIAAQIERGDLGSNAWITGEVADVDPLVVGADLFMAPSWSESFPYANLEAMALGMPIVATDVGGVGEAIEHGVSGFLVPPRQTAPLVEAINLLLVEPARAAALGAAALRRLQYQILLSRRWLNVRSAVYARGSLGARGRSPAARRMTNGDGDPGAPRAGTASRASEAPLRGAPLPRGAWRGTGG